MDAYDATFFFIGNGKILLKQERPYSNHQNVRSLGITVQELPK